MKRRALIIYCDNTQSGNLPGTIHDNNNYVSFLQSKIGGQWHFSEIHSLRNPLFEEVLEEVELFLNGADYSFVIFSGHGLISLDEKYPKGQYIELQNGNLSINRLKTTTKRQTLIIDACRGIYTPIKYNLKPFSEYLPFIGDPFELKTRDIFDDAVMQAEEGISVFYSASRNQSALDTESGGAYLFSLLKTSEFWEETDTMNNVLDLKSAHNIASAYLRANINPDQRPVMNREKRLRNFPFAVK